MALTVEQGFNEFHGRLTTTGGETDAAAAHRASIEDCLVDSLGMTHFFQSGSFGFGTNIHGHSDVDRFAVIPRNKAKKNSRLTLRDMYLVLKRRFPRSGVTIDPPAVRVPFGGGPETTEVIPAVYYKGGGDAPRVFVIPDGKGGWMVSSPEAHREYVTKIDDLRGGYAKPLIRFVKAWKHFRNVPINSFYLECYVTSYAHRESCVYYPFHVAGAFGQLTRDLLADIEDPAGISGTITACRTSALRSKALMTLKNAGRASERAVSADAGGRVQVAFKLWNYVYARKFPAFG